MNTRELALQHEKNLGNEKPDEEAIVISLSVRFAEICNNNCLQSLFFSFILLIQLKSNT